MANISYYCVFCVILIFIRIVALRSIFGARGYLKFIYFFSLLSLSSS